MKTISQLIGSAFVLLTAGLLGSCSYEVDNWNYPTSTVAGQFLYKGQPLQLMGTASDATSSNMIQVHQVGPEWNVGFIKMFAREDGTYSVKTFDGEYYLNLTPGRGPWVPSNDTLRFTLKGEATGLNFNVTPYFWLSDYSSSYKDSVFTATFNLEKVVSTAVLEKVVIHLGTTNIVDNTSKTLERAFTNLTPGTNTVTLNLRTLSAGEKTNLKRTGLLFARIGAKTRNVSDLIYTRTEPLKP
jgi:hypothetical protein